MILIALLAVLQTTASADAQTSNAVVAMPDACIIGGVPACVDRRFYPAPAATLPIHETIPDELPSESTGGTNRLTRGLIGGLIGAVAGVAVCTLISNAFYNEGGGFSTCTTKGNLMFAGGGLAVGFAVGWLTGHDP